MERGYAVASSSKYFYDLPCYLGNIYFGDYEYVSITAHALPGYTFTHWESDDESIDGITDATIVIIMDKNKTVIPVFEGHGCCEGECEGEGNTEGEEGE